MIQIETVAIRELRGIRELEVELHRKNFVVSGPNGSGKSGVVDAVQFGLTGDISRLSGKGTRGLSVTRHGPHVDCRNNPASAEVSLRFYVPDLEKSAVLTRSVRNAKAFSLEPDEPEIRAIIQELAGHPEVTLSRREIIKYILVESGQRAKEIQALLKLEAVGQIRGVLKTTSNRLAAAARLARDAVADADDALCRHLDVSTLTRENVLAAINPNRRTLGLPDIDNLRPGTDLSAGILTGEGASDGGFAKEAALRELAALEQADAEYPAVTQEDVEGTIRNLARLDDDPALLEAIVRRSFVERGLQMVDGIQCPLCDTEWDDEETLRTHLAAKLAKADEAEALQQQLSDSADAISRQALRISRLVDSVQPLGNACGPDGFGEALENWSLDLKGFAAGLSSIKSIAKQRGRLEQGWRMAPDSLEERIAALRQEIQNKPDQSALVAAQAFLTRAQDRFEAWNEAQQKLRRAETAVEAGRVTYNTYCEVTDAYLRELYETVQQDFGSYYREINSEDEGGFKATLEPAEGKLDLEVAFYDQGMYPPGAYHSEGHQDAMGVCLYLALMKQLLGDRFRLAVLDDVVMSVDRGHRKEFCRLLKTSFPDTQFIITTHDKVWAKQMQTEGLVESKGGMAFHSWSVQTGPIVEQTVGIWDDIDSAVAKGSTDIAAAQLRRHVEYVAGELADKLGAKPRFRGDFSYDLGDLLPAVIGRHGELLKLGMKAANKWKDEEAQVRIEALKTARAEALETHRGEAWVVNKAVHFNEWATFSPSEFREVVEAFKELLAELRCSSCHSWLYVTPRKGDPESLRCRCAARMVNLQLQ